MPSCFGTLHSFLKEKHDSKTWLTLFLVTSLPILTACQQMAKTTDSSKQSTSVTQNKTSTAQKIETLLEAEFLLQREGPEKAFDAFYDLASKTVDDKLLERLIQVAIASQNDNYVERSANLWLAADPFAEQAYSLKAQVLIKNQRPEETTTLLINAIRHSVSLQFLPLYLEDHVRDNEKVAVISEAISELPAKYQKDQYIQLSQAHIFLLAGQYEEAITESQQLLERPDLEKNEILFLILAFSQKNIGQLDESIETLLEATNHHPENTRIMASLIDFLVERGDVSHAMSIYNEKTLDDSERLQVGIGFMRTLLANNQPKHVLEVSASLPEESFGFSDQIQFLEAIALAELNETTKAIEIMRNVGGNLRTKATQQIALWFYEENKEQDINEMALTRTLRKNIPEQITRISQLHLQNDNEHLAYDIVSRASDTYPESNALRYRKALLAESLGDWQTTETEIHILLLKDPENPQYLNALGYTLLTRTSRIDEAMKYIESAYKKAEDDPAVIDSLGWGHFLKGELEQASYYLKKAWSLFPDAEIAAHYGEILWKQRHYKEAIEIWETALDSEPNSPFLLETIRRLSPSLIEERPQDITP
ncbi:tetratricopeptide repeat protein [Marinomonas sp. 5E14-1]|uniref:tetratricopeptide repeat protein n=1 Tax=Marinomonas sp. 5E14-1 TaxID=3153922 RepID=UPI0032645968